MEGWRWFIIMAMGDTGLFILYCFLIKHNQNDTCYSARIVAVG